MVEATGICTMQSFLAPTHKQKICTTICGRSSREPTIMRAFSQPSHRKKYGATEWLHRILVEATGIEPTTSASRTLRATSCATPRLFAYFLNKRIHYIKCDFKCQSFFAHYYNYFSIKACFFYIFQIFFAYSFTDLSAENFPALAILYKHFWVNALLP